MADYPVSVKILNDGNFTVQHLRRRIQISDLDVCVSLQGDHGKQSLALTGLTALYRDCPSSPDHGFHLAFQDRQSLHRTLLAAGVRTGDQAVRECERALGTLMTSILMRRTIAL